MLDQVTPLILTFNEAENIQRTLSRLTWARRIVVVDSYSTDDTIRIVKEFQQTEILRRQFDFHANQWNFALEKANVDTDWILALDADFVLTDEFVRTLDKLKPDTKTIGYEVGIRYCSLGKPLRSSIYPPVTVLFRTGHGRHQQDGHASRVVVDGRVDTLKASILHDDRKSLDRWLRTQNLYMELEVNEIRNRLWRDLNWADKIRYMNLGAPVFIFFYCLIIKGGLLDGRAGWYYAIQRALAEALLSLHLLENREYSRSDEDKRSLYRKQT